MNEQRYKRSEGRKPRRRQNKNMQEVRGPKGKQRREEALKNPTKEGRKRKEVQNG